MYVRKAGTVPRELNHNLYQIIFNTNVDEIQSDLTSQLKSMLKEREK